MRCARFCALLVAAIALAGVLAAQPPDKDRPKEEKKEDKGPAREGPPREGPPAKEAAPAKEAGPANPSGPDMTFADGSTVRVTLVAEKVELETKYGKLTIPASDVQRIDFAFRLPEEVAKKVEAAVKKLGDGSFEGREAATKVLRGAGLGACPALEEAAKSEDAEVARRANALVAELREKYPADKFSFPKKDRVQTAEFTVSGRIASPTLRAKTAYFGEADLKLSDLRVFQGYGAGGEARVTIDAAKNGSAANQWLETAITVERDAPLKITASGQVDLWPQTPGQYMTTAKGFGNAAPPAFSAGSLIGKVGEGGTPFLIGERYEGKAPASGKLSLHIIPSHWGNASTGTYDVRVVTGER